ncbi:MAG TPA: NYN domain-containing protein, partial [Hyphomicrobiaceae bacterium]|nr:NYN domain-containing protein [Hyphomicrobiaceae bacterium]
MKRDGGEPVLSAVFVDYDNIYMSLKRKSEDAAKKFAKDAPQWLKGIESGSLITPTNGVLGDARRRIVMNRCYGNPVPRRNTHDSSTDMTSFPFIRHHFLRAGFEVVDCPPLTAQLKNSSDIRMVMDLRDYLTHETYFDEFVILSGDADFTPVLHRLRQHARRTVIYANEYTAQPYTAICDGEIRESDLIALLLGNTDAAEPAPQTRIEVRPATAIPAPQAPTPPVQTSPAAVRAEIIAEIVATVRTSSVPVPLEALADRTLRLLGHEKTIGTGWAGAGSFRELLRQALPPDIRLSENPPFLAFDTRRHDLPSAQPVAEPPRASRVETRPDYEDEAIFEPVAPSPVAPPARPARTSVQTTSQPTAPVPRFEDQPFHAQPAHAAVSQPASAPPVGQRPAPANSSAPPLKSSTTSLAVGQPFVAPVAPPQAQAAPESTSRAQQVIQRIYEASRAPAFAPAEYRAIFEIIAAEINENSIAGKQTITNIVNRAAERGLDLRWEDARFVYDVVSEPDPWFEKGASPNLFGGRFRNYVVQRCRDAGLQLTAGDLDMIDAWFAANVASPQSQRQIPAQPQMAAPVPQPQPQPQPSATD